jgi:hypothetical protein
MTDRGGQNMTRPKHCQLLDINSTQLNSTQLKLLQLAHVATYVIY